MIHINCLPSVFLLVNRARAFFVGLIRYFYYSGAGFVAMKELKITISMKTLPPAYTCDGEDKSPPLEIHGIDNSVSKTLGLIMNDPDAPGGKGFVHWIMWNMELVSVLPEDIPKTPAITFPIGALQGVNNAGRIGY